MSLSQCQFGQISIITYDSIVSLSDRMGILVPGDQIIHINGASTSGYSLYEANELIRKCYDVMRITVKKDEEIQGQL